MDVKNYKDFFITQRITIRRVDTNKQNTIKLQISPCSISQYYFWKSSVYLRHRQFLHHRVARLRRLLFNQTYNINFLSNLATAAQMRFVQLQSSSKLTS